MTDQHAASVDNTVFPANPPRVLITKIGLDGHDRGSRIVAANLRDAGMEVIYTPPWQSIESVVQLALQEDVDVIGISSLATDHLVVPEMMKALKAAGLDAVQVFMGGIIPQQEIPMLKESGVRAIFGPGSQRDEIVGCAQQLANDARRLKRGLL
ncbi:cobalamin B12-binding domain-containing protein [Haliea sp.]